MPFNLFNWQGLLLSGIISAVAAGYAAYHFTAIGYQKTISDMKLAKADQDLLTAKATLNQFSIYVSQIDGAAKDYAALKDSLDINFSVIGKQLSNATKAKPLPADCKPDDGRVRALSAAIAAANNQAASH